MEFGGDLWSPSGSEAVPRVGEDGMPSVGESRLRLVILCRLGDAKMPHLFLLFLLFLPETRSAPVGRQEEQAASRGGLRVGRTAVASAPSRPFSLCKA